MADLNELKKAAGVRAANMIESGMTVGLGTGSTAAYMVERLGERIQTEGLKVTAVSTSWSTTLQCRKLGIPLIDLGEASHLDIAIDGADEIDPNKNLIKGRGAAHLLEKIVASMADNYIIIADSGKKVQTLGEKFAVPLEILPNAIGSVTYKVTKLGATLAVRMGAPGKDGPVISDSGNLIADAKFGPIADPAKLDFELNKIPGLLGHGLFIGMANKVILAAPNGLEEF
ncbi:MAG: ribose-5-phosphate isomerase RpiA [Hallerella sp.]|jgi:ribose 5-phosphate isomerase A|nr:ribose-5-phosphate isomerase RpiA [Fibrobacter sp.]MDY6368826.1 ribose-5-phosphate isomerase RpiA [Fibrobacter sp.]MDY6389339.1 ribose-5-phosphate isomerase RpiA [Fibrobacter sp.]MEE3340829.1 ribose-5-phosphate isomerase RpiA [Hallerella sp.]